MPSCSNAFWEFYPNTAAPGGVTVSGSTRELCVGACESRAGCVGLNFKSGVCTVFDNTVPYVTAGATAGSEHLRRCDATVACKYSTKIIK